MANSIEVFRKYLTMDPNEVCPPDDTSLNERFDYFLYSLWKCGLITEGNILYSLHHAINCSYIKEDGENLASTQVASSTSPSTDIGSCEASNVKVEDIINKMSGDVKVLCKSLQTIDVKNIDCVAKKIEEYFNKFDLYEKQKAYFFIYLSQYVFCLKKVSCKDADESFLSNMQSAFYGQCINGVRNYDANVFLLLGATVGTVYKRIGILNDTMPNRGSDVYMLSTTNRTLSPQELDSDLVIKDSDEGVTASDVLPSTHLKKEKCGGILKQYFTSDDSASKLLVDSGVGRVILFDLSQNSHLDAGKSEYQTANGIGYRILEVKNIKDLKQALCKKDSSTTSGNGLIKSSNDEWYCNEGCACIERARFINAGCVTVILDGCIGYGGTRADTYTTARAYALSSLIPEVDKIIGSGKGFVFRICVVSNYPFFLRQFASVFAGIKDVIIDRTDIELCSDLFGTGVCRGIDECGTAKVRVVLECCNDMDIQTTLPDLVSMVQEMSAFALSSAVSNGLLGENSKIKDELGFQNRGKGKIDYIENIVGTSVSLN